MLNFPGVSVTAISKIGMGINNFFDTSDEYFLAGKLKTEGGIFGMATSFGEPVKADIYYDPSKTSPEKIKLLIEEREERIMPGKSNERKESHFSVTYINKAEKLSVMQFMKLLYEPVDESFNGFDSIPAANLEICQLSFPQAINSELQEWIPYLVSHSSNDDGIVRFQTLFSDSIPQLRIWYVKGLSNSSSIIKLLNQPQLKVYYPDGTDKMFKNRFSIIGPVEIIRVK